MVDSVLGVVNELLGAVLGKSGSTLLLLCTCSYLSTPLPQWVGYQRLRPRPHLLRVGASSSRGLGEGVATARDSSPTLTPGLCNPLRSPGGPNPPARPGSPGGEAGMPGWVRVFPRRHRQRVLGF